ncbi:DUF5398 family protein [Neochlamydia sp. S13]|uniref:DUF5398 family protein n=1 Tax=Neochlamydia sp. S13 TaxID=1353976 RepID=UPI0005A96220|nr:DUF5398 family protein [Neochlamydia sp. S13]BBI17852.1 needle chaperone SctE [Neochlamydia sp. S13]
MFGLEKQKKKKGEEFTFELEKELKTFNSHQDYKKKVEERIQDIRSLLRKGENKDEFDKLGVLLHGYTSLLKVMSRLSPK